MSVGLGTLIGDDVEEVEVMSSDYDAEWIRLDQVNPEQMILDSIVLDRNQMQQLSVIIDRFLDK